MTQDQRDFIELTRRAIKEASPIAFSALCSIRGDDPEEASELVLRFALTNGLTPLEAMAHIETYLTET